MLYTKDWLLQPIKNAMPYSIQSIYDFYEMMCTMKIDLYVTP